MKIEGKCHLATVIPRLLVGLALCWQTTVYASDSINNNKAKLQAIATQISTVKQNIISFQSKKNEIQTSLKTIEINIGSLSQKIQHTHQQITTQKNLLTSTQKQLTVAQQKLVLQRQLLAEQLQAAYILGQQPYLKILLNQENPNKIARYLEYYKALNQARLAMIEEIKETAEEVQNTSATLQSQTKSLMGVQQDLQTQQSELSNQHSARTELLNTTEKAIQDKTQELNKLMADKNALENIISTLITQQKAAPPITSGVDFGSVKSKFHAPVDHGKIIQQFGEPIAYGRMRSSGILVAANAGQPVYAISSGKVIFADWLHGFGLLVIIQHGSSYLSLYGRNQSITVKTGEIVQTGQPIGAVGDSGGFNAPALYFEVRHNGAPINPINWLRQ